jgi:hypothetical protein
MNLLKCVIAGYALSVAIETPVLVSGLSACHSFRVRLFAGLWLTACTYPIVVMTLPALTGRFYVPIAETVAPLAECVLFGTLVEKWKWRDMAVIVLANLASFAVGEIFRIS